MTRCALVRRPDHDLSHVITDTGLQNLANRRKAEALCTRASRYFRVEHSPTRVCETCLAALHATYGVMMLPPEVEQALAFYILGAE